MGETTQTQRCGMCGSDVYLCVCVCVYRTNLVAFRELTAAKTGRVRPASRRTDVGKSGEHGFSATSRLRRKG